MNLELASPDELRAIIAQQQATIARLEARIRELEGQGDGTTPTGMPGHRSSSRARPPRKAKEDYTKRERAFTRPRSAPMHRVVHAAERCPDCGTHLLGGWVKRTREVIELPVAPVAITEHVLIERECPLCRVRVVPTDALRGVVDGKQRLGVRLVSLIATLREAMRLPVRMIQRYLRAIHGLALSVGAIVAAGQRVAARGTAEVAAIRAAIRASPVAQADETGWRQDGENGYVWIFRTPTACLFRYGTRGGTMVDTVLGEAFAGVLVSDFYAAYDHLPGWHQRCWPHLLRAIHDLRVRHPDDARLQGWARRVRRVYDWAVAYRGATVAERHTTALRCMRVLARVCRPYLEDASAAQRTLCRRISKYLAQLFVFVARPEVPSHNNDTERDLRHLVISRKISGGTRSAEGTTTKMTLSTLYGTWRLQERNPFDESLRLLSSPQA